MPWWFVDQLDDHIGKPGIGARGGGPGEAHAQRVGPGPRVVVPDHLEWSDTKPRGATLTAGVRTVQGVGCGHGSCGGPDRDCHTKS